MSKAINARGRKERWKAFGAINGYYNNRNNNNKTK